MTTDPTPPAVLDLDAIESRANAATGGPWDAETYRRVLAGLATSTGNHAADAKFIRTARAIVPAVTAEVRRLRAELERVTAELDQARRLADLTTEQVTAYARIIDDTRAERDRAAIEAAAAAQAYAELTHVGLVLTDWRSSFTGEPAHEADRVLADLIDAHLVPTAKQPLPAAAVPGSSPRAQEPDAGGLAEHLAAHQWYSGQYENLYKASEHRSHNYNSDCAICRHDLRRIAEVALAYVGAAVQPPAADTPTPAQRVKAPESARIDAEDLPALRIRLANGRIAGPELAQTAAALADDLIVAYDRLATAYTRLDAAVDSLTEGTTDADR